MTAVPDFLSHLNPSQQQAVKHFCGPLLVVAGAGSGKTRALTYRISNLVLTHRINPENILAVTFTNKAAKEMKARIETLFAERLAQEDYGKSLQLLNPQTQTRLRSRVYKTITKPLWIGTFHSLCARILRYEIHKFKDEKGRSWQRNFSIFDESDVQSLVKDLVINQLNLDERKFNPRSVRYAISTAKNQGWTPQDLEADQPTYRGRVIAEVYSAYQDALAANNALDFDDLIRVLVQLLQQNEQALAYWHQQFHHILVDEYQDTNRTQYDLLRLLVTNGADTKTFDHWHHRSVFVVGDADQCLPPDTQIMTPQGQRPIAQLQVGDQVLTTGGQTCLQPRRVTHIRKGSFQGPLWCIQAGDRVLKGTPHHILLSRMVPLPNRYYVYLMYKAERGYRVGLTTGQRQNSYRKPEIGFKVRMGQEHADKLWVLKATDSYEEAVYYEAYFAAQYGLPTMVFHSKGRKLKISDDLIFKLFQEVDTIANAQALMQDLWLHKEFPHYRPQNGLRRQTLNLTMFGNVRSERKVPKADHRLQWSSNREEIADHISTAGFPIRAGKLPGTYRFETARTSYRDAVGLAHQVSTAGQLEIRRRAQINGLIYDFMSLSHLHPGMRILLEVEGQLQETAIDAVWQEAYDGPVYDLEVEQNHTYLAEGILVHNSIYSFRAADFTILMGFQNDFGDGLPDGDTRTMVKLEENYRSTENILQVANELIENNTERIDKLLKPTRGPGEPIFCHRAEDEIDEADFVIDQIRSLERSHPEVSWGDFAILYRTNAQSRALEEVLVRWGIPYTVVGGLKFYDRKEIKDVLAYLRLLVNPADTVSLKRIINTPRRGIGKTTMDRLTQAAQELGVPVWEILSDETSVKTLASRASRPILKFVEMMQQWQSQVEKVPATEIIQGILDDSGYVRHLQDQGTDEADERLGNVQELYNAALQYAEENADEALTSFLASAALASELDNLEGGTTVSLMTLHSAKGLEFPIVFLVGLEQGLFPNYRSLDDPIALEEERRLCYVGITRAQERLFLSHARARRLYGSREPATPSLFLSELPRDLIQTDTSSALPAPGLDSFANVRSPQSKLPNTHEQDWSVGDRLVHKGFGIGEVTHIFGAANKICLAVKFPGLGRKIIDPKVTTLQRVE